MPNRQRGDLYDLSVPEQDMEHASKYRLGLNAGGGDGTSDGMDPWQQSVETRLGALEGKLDNHLKWLLIAFAGGFIALGGLVLNRSDGLSGKMDQVNERIGDLRADLAALRATSAPPALNVPTSPKPNP